jgi:hypothetical protein
VSRSSRTFKIADTSAARRSAGGDVVAGGGLRLVGGGPARHGSHRDRERVRHRDPAPRDHPGHFAGADSAVRDLLCRSSGAPVVGARVAGADENR